MSGSKLSEFEEKRLDRAIEKSAKFITDWGTVAARYLRERGLLEKVNAEVTEMNPDYDDTLTVMRQLGGQ